MTQRWIELTGAVNVRDLGGLPTVDGSVTRSGRVLRADNLQQLSPTDIELLVDTLGVTDVVDLRTSIEIAMEGPGPLTEVPGVTIHHYSLYPERDDDHRDNVLPWVREAEEAGEWEPLGNHYWRYLDQKADSVVGALRAVARSKGAAIVHCAAGKDRTGVISALALAVADVQREAIVADYVLTSERVEAIIARLKVVRAYAADLDNRPLDSHYPVAEAMEGLFTSLDSGFGGPLGWLTRTGWTADDNATLRARLLV